MIGLVDFDLQPSAGWMMTAAWDTGDAVSSNSGSSWTFANTSADSTQILADVGSSTRFWEGYAAGLFHRTDNGGATWTSLNLAPSSPGHFEVQCAHDRIPQAYLYAVSSPNLPAT